MGGGTKSFIDVANMLKKNYKVIACIPKGSKELIEILKHNKIAYHEFTVPIPVLNIYSGRPPILSKGFLGPFLNFRYKKTIIKELLSLHPEAIIYNSLVTSLLANSMPTTVKNICIVRETFTNSIINTIFSNNFKRHFKGVAFIAEHEKKKMNLANVKTIVIPDCLDPESVKSDIDAGDWSYKIPKEKFTILFLGGMAQIKGINVLLKAMSYLGDEYHLIILGSFDETMLKVPFIVKRFFHLANVKFLISIKYYLGKLKSSNQVSHIGYINNIEPLINITDVLVFPSTSAHQPRPCIEAGYYSKAVIISDFEATKEYFINGYNALTFVPGNAKDLANKIKVLKDSPVLKKRLGSNNYLMTKEYHDYAKTKNKLIAFINECMN